VPSSGPVGKNALATMVAATVFALTACDGASGPPAPRTRASRAAATACTGTEAHDAHAAVGIGCAVCHPCGGRLELGPYTFPGGTSTAGGVIHAGDGTTPTTCAVQCHAVHGSPPSAIAWDAPAPLDCTACHAVAALPPTHPRLVDPAPPRSVCLGCHDQTTHTRGTIRVVGHGPLWMDPADLGFHAYAANLGLANCQACHGPELTGGVTGVACARCHDQSLPPGVASWRVDCLMCHGGVDDASGAPPRATWGKGSDLVRVGAHTAHVTGSVLAPPFDCTVCHVKPTDALSAGHVDAPTAAVRFDGLGASRGPTPASWDRTAATCSNTYCHGTPAQGGSNHQPVWTSVGSGQAACGTCHGVPPPPPHVVVEADFVLCSVCHADTLDPGGGMIPPAAGGKHLDGIVEATGHEATWMDPADPNFHAFTANRSLAACTPCHGVDLGGGTVGVGCARCHGGTWRTSCTMCHGGTFDITGAPPRTTWGNSGDAVRVGAHQRHVSGGSIGAPNDCDVCHVTPSEALSSGHVDSATASVVYGGLAVQGGAAPVWTRASATCASTYCHGSYSGVYTYFYWEEERTVPYQGLRATAIWTGGPMTCGSCHGNPPRTGVWHSGSHAGGNDCQLCHPNATGVNGAGTAITNRATHANGALDVAPQWNSRCFRCH